MHTTRLAALLVLPIAVIAFVAVMWPFEPHLTVSDRQALLALARARTSEPVLSVRTTSFWRAEIRTGVQKGPLDGHGRFFVARWMLGEWRIELEGTWVS